MDVREIQSNWMVPIYYLLWPEQILEQFPERRNKLCSFNVVAHLLIGFD